MRDAILVLLAMLHGAWLGAQQPGAPAAATAKVSGTCTGFDVAEKTPVRVSLWLHDYETEGAQLVADTRADAAGAFTFADVPWPKGHAWGRSFYVLVARQKDRVALVELRRDDAAAHPLAVELRKASSVRGTVTDDAGRPLAGARVHLAGMMRPAKAGLPIGLWIFAEPMPPWVTHCGTDGSFVLDGLPPDWTYMLDASHAGRVRTRQNQPAEEPFLFALEPAAALRGKVSLESGGPAARVRVCAQSVGSSTYTFATARTDENGAYTLEGLPGGTYNVWAEAEDLTVVALAGMQAHEGQTDDLDTLVLVRGQRITGVVLDADTGEPVQPGARGDVAMYGPARPRSGGACEVAPIGADGRFTLRAAPGAVHVYLRCSHEGWDPVGTSACDLQIQAGADQEIVFKVRRAPARR